MLTKSLSPAFSGGKSLPLVIRVSFYLLAQGGRFSCGRLASCSQGTEVCLMTLYRGFPSTFSAKIIVCIVAHFEVACPGPLHWTHTRGQRPERQWLGGHEEVQRGFGGLSPESATSAGEVEPQA